MDLIGRRQCSRAQAGLQQEFYSSLWPSHPLFGPPFSLPKDEMVVVNDGANSWVPS